MAKKLFTESLREAVRTAPVTRYKISQATGISQANLSRFVHGTRGLSMESLDALCDFLGLSLTHAKHKGNKNG
jgi:DNA-binding Xre family transcriptional regulator